MTRSPKPQDTDTITGKTVRIRAEGIAIRSYPAGPTAPERVSVEIDGMVTVVPAAKLEIVR